MQNSFKNIKNLISTTVQRIKRSIRENFQKSAYQREITILVAVAGLLLIIVIISIIFSGRGSSPTLPVENSSITSGVFTLSNEGGKIYVETRDPDIIDKDQIRKLLGIPANIDFEVIVPGAASERSFDDDPTYEPPVMQDPGEELHQ